MTPTISILFATFNEDVLFLKRSIKSIQDQTFQDWELIICLEPGETNQEFFEELAKNDKRVVLSFNETKFGLAKSLAKAVSLSRGKYCARMDSDDENFLERFQLQLEFLEKNPDIQVVGTSLFLVDGMGPIYANRHYPERHFEILKKFLVSNALAHPTVMFHREAILRVGNYNSEYRFAEDLELWLRCLSAGYRFANLNQPLLMYNAPMAQFSKRSRDHWLFNLKARRLYAPKVWPFVFSKFTVLFAWLITLVPSEVMTRIKFGYIIDKLRGVRSSN